MNDRFVSAFNDTPDQPADDLSVALAILRQLVDGPNAGIEFYGIRLIRFCIYCNLKVEERKTAVDHEDDCPIRLGRRLLGLPEVMW